MANSPLRVSFTSDVLRDDLSGKLLQFTNCRVLKDGALKWEDVWVENGRILSAAVVFYDRRRLADVQIDCERLILSPGFIDLQFNGLPFSPIPVSHSGLSSRRRFRG
jgi:N-acetylglucosamine-6-phosphate deacetylase